MSLLTATEDNECAICCKEYAAVTVVLDCEHKFCKLCVTEWFSRKIGRKESNMECAKCRHPIADKFLSQLLSKEINEQYHDLLLEKLLEQENKDPHPNEEVEVVDEDEEDEDIFGCHSLIYRFNQLSASEKRYFLQHIEYPPEDYRETLEKLKVTDIQKECVKYGLYKYGRKADLIERLAAYKEAHPNAT
jgi:hypothetical protein